MDGRKINANPRPCYGRRVVAKKWPRGGMDGFVNSVKKLQKREISSKRGRAFSMSAAQERFRNIHLQEWRGRPKSNSKSYFPRDPSRECSQPDFRRMS